MTRHVALQSLIGAAVVIALAVLPACIFKDKDNNNEVTEAPTFCPVLEELQERIGGRVWFRTPAGFAFGSYVINPDGAITPPGSTECVVTIAERLGLLCQDCELNPGRCEALIRAVFDEVPPECSQCGDGVCVAGESEGSCPRDCLDRCGDGFCAEVETALRCPVDCAVACGDGRCSGRETPDTCPEDCDYTEGDGVCSPGETPENSPADCSAVTCGDGYCQTYETSLRCPEDCCGATICGGADTVCRGSHDLYACERLGEGGCPEFALLETCPWGCVEGRCRTCDDVVGLNSAFSQFGRACDPDTEAPTCEYRSGTSTELLPNDSIVRRCEPIPGLDGCGLERFDSCPAEVAGDLVQTAFCREGVCVRCAPGTCTPGEVRCEDGLREVCAPLVAGGCQAWVPEPCADGLACGVVESEPGACCAANGCDPLSGARECVGSISIHGCQATGATDPCPGERVEVERCAPGTFCDIMTGTGVPVCEACCAVGTSRCRDVDGTAVIEQCNAHPFVVSCGQWARVGDCGVGTCSETDGTAACDE
jgi:hypothetical protein